MKSEKFIFLSFIPALAYWYLESYYPIRIAVTVGVVLALLEILLERFFLKKVHSISLLNFVLIALLGSLSLLGEDGIWFKLQPVFTGLFLGSFVLWKNLTGASIGAELVPQNQNNFIYLKLERNLSILLICYGVFMLPVALYLTTGQWLFWKTGGFYIVSLVFIVANLIYYRRQ